MPRKATSERVSLFSDGVFAVLITVLVLELHPPETPSYAALVDLWPHWLSYVTSFLFIAIVWINHHYLLRYAGEVSSRLLWFNFAHLFSISLVPLSTEWMASSALAPQPVSFYAAVFFFVNATYVALIWELVDVDPAVLSAAGIRQMLRMRSVATLVLFGLAALLSLASLVIGIGICLLCLIVYLKPEPTMHSIELPR